MAVAFVGHQPLGGGNSTGELSTSGSSFTAAEAGDLLFLVVSGNYLTGSSDVAKAVTVDSSWTFIGSEDRSRRATASPLTRGTIAIWWKNATASDLGEFDVEVGTGYVGAQREWYARGFTYRPSYGVNSGATTGGVGNSSDAIVEWQSPSATASGHALALTLYRTANVSGPQVVDANGWTNDYSGTVSGFSQYIAMRSQEIQAETVTGPTWVGSTSHMAVVFTVRWIGGGIYVDGAVHL